MYDTRTIHRGLLVCLLLSAVLAAALHAKVETQAARIATLEAEVADADSR
jgi:cell division protein FtsB